MEIVREIIGALWSYILNIRFPSDFIDIAVIAFLIYKLTTFIRKTNFTRFAKGIVLLLSAMWLSSLFQLQVIEFILGKTMELGVLLLVILFQPELRRLLEKVGSSNFGGIFNRRKNIQEIENAIVQTVLACTDLSKRKVGALVVFERDNKLDDIIRTGTIIDAEATAELIKNIFYPKAPMHDGALIVRDGRIESAGCMLPLSVNSNLSRELGMRHRAGIGMSEYSDAVTVIVSEESGSISVAVDGMLKRHLATETFEKLLRKELIADNTTEKRKAFKVKKNDKGNNK